MELTFTSRNTTQTVMVPILGGDVVESTESFTVSLTSADSAAMLNPSTTSVTIQDDDSKFLRGGWGRRLIWRALFSDLKAWLSKST